MTNHRPPSRNDLPRCPVCQQIIVHEDQHMVCRAEAKKRVRDAELSAPSGPEDDIYSLKRKLNRAQANEVRLTVENLKLRRGKL